MTSMLPSTSFSLGRNSIYSNSSINLAEPVSTPTLLQDRDFVHGFSCFQRDRDSQFNKAYQFGFLQKKGDNKAKTKANRGKWSGWYVELIGLTLTMWPASSPNECFGPQLVSIKKRKPHSFNINDCNVFTIQFEGNPHAFVLHISGSKHMVFQTATIAELQSWMLAFRLANVELSLLHEYYTALVFHSNQHRPLFNFHISEYSFSGMVELRCTGMQKWTRLWMTFHNQAQPYITFGPASHSPDFLFKVTSVHQAYLLYPGHPTLVEQSAALRLDGDILTTYDASIQQNNSTFLILSSTSQNEIMSILLALYAHFQLPSLPTPYSFNPLNLDAKEMISVPVIGASFKETHLAILSAWRHKIKAVPTPRSVARPRERKKDPFSSTRFSTTQNQSRPLSYLPLKSRSAVVASKTDLLESSPPEEDSLMAAIEKTLSGLDKDISLDDTPTLPPITESIDNDSDIASPITPVAIEDLSNLYPEFNELTISDVTAQLTLNDPTKIPRIASPVQEKVVEKARPRPRITEPRSRPFSLASVLSSKFSSPFSSKAKKSAKQEKTPELEPEPVNIEENKLSSQLGSDSASSDTISSHPDDDDEVPIGSKFTPMDPTLLYNPALQRPSTLLEVRDYAKYSEQLKSQARIGPLIALPTKPATQPEVPRPPAITSTHTQLKTTRATARPRLNSDSAQFDPRSLYPSQYRTFGTQSQIFPHEVNYKHFGPEYSHFSNLSPYRNNEAFKSTQSPRLIPSPENKPFHSKTRSFQSQVNLGMEAVARSRPGVPLATRQTHTMSCHGYQQPAASSSRHKIGSQDNLVNKIPKPSKLSSPSSDSLSKKIDYNDEVPVGVLMGKKPPSPPPVVTASPPNSHHPTLIKGNYREHAASQSRLSLKYPSIDEESDIEIDGDVEDIFEDFIERHLKARSGNQLTSALVFQVFFQYCQTVDLDFEDIPSPSLFIRLMKRAGFNSKSVGSNLIWQHLAIINYKDAGLQSVS